MVRVAGYLELEELNRHPKKRKWRDFPLIPLVRTIDTEKVKRLGVFVLRDSTFYTAPVLFIRDVTQDYWLLFDAPYLRARLEWPTCV